MDFLRLALLSVLLARASSNPIATDGLRGHVPLPLSPASPQPATSDARVATSPGPMRQSSESWAELSMTERVGPVNDHGPPKPPPTSVSMEMDEAMKPILGRRHVLGRSGLSVVTLAPELASADGASLIPIPQGCTTTLPRSSPVCLWDGTEMVYPSTVIMRKSVDCHGCSFIQDNFYNCPNRQIVATKEESTPLTYWSTVCATSTPQSQVAAAAAATTVTGGPGTGQAVAAAPSPTITLAPQPTAALGARQDVLPAACPTTYVVQPEKSAGKTLTTYLRFTTTTILLNCGGCPLVLSTALVGYGPPAEFTKTTTLPVGTKKTYACQ